LKVEALWRRFVIAKPEICNFFRRWQNIWLQFSVPKRTK
jgi:hypothetical protein